MFDEFRQLRSSTNSVDVRTFCELQPLRKSAAAGPARPFLFHETTSGFPRKIDSQQNGRALELILCTTSGHSIATRSDRKDIRNNSDKVVKEFVNEGPPAPSGSQAVPAASDSMGLDVAIETYRQMPVLSQDADPLRFWEANSTATVLQPLLPLVASVSAVPATEAICERLFKAGGQVLTSARLQMMGSRVESILMTNFNSKHADAAGA